MTLPVTELFLNVFILLCTLLLLNCNRSLCPVSDSILFVIVCISTTETLRGQGTFYFL